MSKHVVVSIVLITLLLGAAGGGMAWLVLTRPKPKQEEPKPPVPTVLAPPVEARTNYRVRVVGFGSARPRVRLQIAPQVAGEIVAKAENFLSGKHVKRGQMLLEIDKTDYRLARDAAQRNVELLQVQLERLDTEEANLRATEKIETERLQLAGNQLAKARRLLARGAASQTDVDTAEESMLLRKSQHQGVLNQLALVPPQRRQLQAQIAVAKVQLDQSVTALNRTTVVSPVTGRVLSCNVEAGERVAVGQACGELYGTDVMDVPVPVPAADLAWLDRPERLGPVPASADAAEQREIPAEVVWGASGRGREVTWRGRVHRIEAGLAAQTRTAAVVVEVRNPPIEGEGALLDLNMFCEVKILGRTLPEAYILPRQAILQDKKSVYVVNSGRLRRRTVRVARLAGEEALLLPGGGIEAGDRVIVGYVPKPVLGMRVKAVDRLESGPAPASRPAPATRPVAQPGGIAHR